MITFKSKQKKFEGDLKTKICGKRLYSTKSVKTSVKQSVRRRTSPLKCNIFFAFISKFKVYFTT